MWICPVLRLSVPRTHYCTRNHQYWSRGSSRTRRYSSRCRSRSRSPLRPNRRRAASRRRRPARRPVLMQWRRQSDRVQTLIGEICEALLDLGAYEDTPATKSEIAKEMDERTTKRKVAALFIRERPKTHEFETAIRFGLTYGFIKYHGKNDSGIPTYDLESEFKDLLYHIRGDFEEAILSLDDPMIPPEPLF